MSSDTKRRRVGEGGCGGDGIPPVDGGYQNDNTSVQQELIEMKSKMNELMGNMTNMLQMMQAQSNAINNMQGDINRLTQKCHSMETSILDSSTATSLLRTTCDRIEDKQKYHDVMLQNQQWKYSAPYPDDDYWTTLDEDEDEQAEKFLEQIKKCTEKMRYGKGDGSIDINSDLPYNQVFQPHWKEFANSLKQYHYHLKHSPDIVSTLNLWNIKLPENVIDLLSNAFKSTHFQKIDLRNNSFGQKGINFILKYLRSNRNLKELSLRQNPIDNINVKKLCKIVQTHPSIKILHLTGCTGDDINGYGMLKMIMTAGRNKLEEIYLSNNNISTRGGTFISDFLATNPSLEVLFLSGNKLNDNDTIGIAEALKQNTKLCFLNLTSNNNITKTGWKALRKAEFDDTSLNATSDCNHSCNIHYPSDGSDVIEDLDIIEMNGDRNFTKAFDPTLVRQKKIYSVLSSRNRDNSNVGHFDDIHVKLLPNMLNSIQKYSNYQDDNISQVRGHVQPLSIVYDICRNWEESIAVFEALSS